MCWCNPNIRCVSCGRPECKPTLKQRRAIIPMSLAALHKLLNLPENVAITGVVQTDNDRFTGECSILLEGDGLPGRCLVHPGEIPLKVSPQYKVKMAEVERTFDAFV